MQKAERKTKHEERERLEPETTQKSEVLIDIPAHVYLRKKDHEERYGREDRDRKAEPVDKIVTLVVHKTTVSRAVAQRTDCAIVDILLNNRGGRIGRIIPSNSRG